MRTSACDFAEARTNVGPPISIISIKSPSLTGGSWAATSSNGYRFTATRSILGYPNSSSVDISSGLSPRARMAACIAGWRVLTRPSNTSGWPVTSVTSVTSRAFSRRRRAVPPVDRICQPIAVSAVANAVTPDLS